MKLRSGKVINYNYESQNQSKNQSQKINVSDDELVNLFKQHLMNVQCTDFKRDKVNYVVDLYNDLVKHRDFIYKNNRLRYVVICKVYDLINQENFKELVVSNKNWKGKYYYLNELSRVNIYTLENRNVINRILFDNPENMCLCSRHLDFNLESVNRTVSRFNRRMQLIQKINRRVKFITQSLYQMCFDKIKKIASRKPNSVNFVDSLHIPYHIKQDLLYLFDWDKYPPTYGLMHTKKIKCIDKIVDYGYTQDDFIEYLKYCRSHRSGYGY